MFRTSFVRPNLIAALFACSVAVASAQSKVAIINLQKAVLDTADIKAASAALEAKYKPRQAEGEKLRKELDGIQQKLQAGAGKLTPEAEADLNVQAQRKQRDLQRLSEDLQSEFEAERNDVLSKSSQRMQEVVKKIAEEKGYDVIVDVTNTIFYKPTLEITADATAAYDKTYPSK